MYFLTEVTDDSTLATKARGVTCLALVTLGFVRAADLLHNVQHIKETVDKEGSLKARDSILGKRSSLTAIGTFHCLFLPHQ